MQHGTTKRRADKVSAQAGFAPGQGRNEVGMVELHDCFVANGAVYWAGRMQASGLLSTLDKRGKYGLVHNIGTGGVVVASLLRRPEFLKPGGIDGRTRYAATFFMSTDDTSLLFDRLGYKHGWECKPVTLADLDKVKSKNSSRCVLQAAKL